MFNTAASLGNLSDAELSEKRALLRVQIDNNDGRLTAGSSADLDHWHDQLIDVNREIERRASLTRGTSATLPVASQVDQ